MATKCGNNGFNPNYIVVARVGVTAVFRQGDQSYQLLAQEVADRASWPDLIKRYSGSERYFDTVAALSRFADRLYGDRFFQGERLTCHCDWHFYIRSWHWFCSGGGSIKGSLASRFFCRIRPRDGRGQVFFGVFIVISVFSVVAMKNFVRLTARLGRNALSAH